MTAFLITSGFIFLTLIAADFYLSKRYQIKKTKGILYKTVNRQHFITETIIFLVFIFFMLGTQYINYGKFALIPLFVFSLVIYSVRAGFEFMYEKESKRYLKSFIGAIGMLLVFVSALLTL